MSLVSDPVPSGEHVTITVWSTRVVHGVCRDRVTKRPLSKHPVHVVVPIGNGSNVDETHALRLSTRTDSDGRYRVRVPLGTWVKVGTTGPGCLVECFVHVNEENDFAVGVGAPMFAGTVLGSGGRPFAHAVVQDANDPRIRCRTDARGNFRLQPKAIHQHQRWIHVFAAGHPPKAFHLVGDTKPARVLAIPPGNRLRVRLVGTNGKPLASRSIVLGGYSTPPAILGHKITSRELRTDANGVFDAHVPTGCKYLSAFVQHKGRYVWFFTGAPKAGGDIGNLMIAPVSEVRGRVIYGTRLPAAGQRILLMRLPDDGSKPDVIIRAHKRLPAIERWTDRGGRFAFPSLQPGTYEVAFIAEHHGPVVRRFRVPLGRDDGKLIRKRQLWFQLSPRRPVRGVVVDQTGAPVKGATVTGTPHGHHTAGIRPAMWRFGLNAQAQAKTSTDKRGRFSLFASDDDTLVMVNAYLYQKPRWFRTHVVRVDPKKPGMLRLVMR